MTGYREEDSTYKNYDLETIQGELTWRVRIYKQGNHICTIEDKKKKVAIKFAKKNIDENGS